MTTPTPPAPTVAKSLPDVVTEIQSALDAKPTRWDYDSNQTPFYNDADGNSRGGDSDGTYCLYGPDFFIDGEHYEGPVLAQRCGKADAKFIAACNPENMRVLLSAISSHEAEVGRLREALKLAEVAMNHMGDALNNMDAVEVEDLVITEPAFKAVRAALTQGETN